MANVLYIGYGNPASLPPIMNSASMLRQSGCRVTLLGVVDANTSTMRISDPDIQTVLLRYPRLGHATKLFFIWFCLRVCVTAIRIRPTHLYVSDMMACPVGWLIQKFLRPRVIYHEHDTPMLGATSLRDRLVLAGRDRLIRSADRFIVPNQMRADFVQQQIGVSRIVDVVWNCPGLSELPDMETDNLWTKNNAPGKQTLDLYYAGSFNDARLPVSILDAMAAVPATTLTLIGYETNGNPGFLDRFFAAATQRGLVDRVRLMGTLATRKEVFDQLAKADIVLSLMPMRNDDINMRAMACASNKAFDAFACGVPILVSDLPDWVDAFVRPGVAIACDPTDPASIQATLEWVKEHPEQTAQMGRQSRRHIDEVWNYENQFQPVLQWMVGKP